MPGCLSNNQTLIESDHEAVNGGLPLQIILQRRDVCRQCPQATRNAQRVHLPTKGLTTKSVCRVMKTLKPEKAALIAKGTAMPESSCPLGHWRAFNPSGSERT